VPVTRRRLCAQPAPFCCWIDRSLFCPALPPAAAIEEAEDAIVDALVKAGPTPRQQFILIRWAQKAAGALVGVATAAFLLFYQWVIEPAAPNSLRVRAWAQLTNVRLGACTGLLA
jgi:hypothetical protein